MPTYDYECRACGNRIEVIHGMTEPGPTSCDRCAGPVRRVLHAAGIIFKGSGFYKTDSRSASSPSGVSTSSTTAKDAAPPDAAASGDSKTSPGADAGTRSADASGPPAKSAEPGPLSF